MIVLDFLVWVAEPAFRLLDRLFPVKIEVDALSETEVELLGTRLGPLLEMATLLGVRFKGKDGPRK